ncbi:MAG: YezD family protein [Lachnospiraceae bacterium]|nr:YezD family protein [Lachnospiraceae bacterium]MEE0960056.1 YezD family protein [Lachnospiraceae bacterium]
MEKERKIKDAHLVTLEKLLDDMKFGNITIIVQDGKIVQIDKTEKYRIRE